MKEVFKPIALGVGAYILSAICIWLIVSFLLLPLIPGALGLYPPLVIFMPLLVSGYVGAKTTLSRYRSRKITFGVVAGLIGYGIFLLVSQSQGAIWFFAILTVGAAVVAGLAQGANMRSNTAFNLTAPDGASG